MPRKQKAQPPATSPGQPYGVSGEQQAAMAQLPLPEQGPVTPGPALAQPDVGGVPRPGAPPPPMAGGPPQPTLPIVDPMAAALADAQAMAPPPEGGLFRPTERPDEPLTAGLGAPIQQGPQSPTAQVFQILADLYDNEPMRAMAEEARQKGIA